MKHTGKNKYNSLLEKVCDYYVENQPDKAEKLIVGLLLTEAEQNKFSGMSEKMEHFARRNRQNKELWPLIETYEAFTALDEYYRIDGRNEVCQEATPLYEYAYCALEKLKQAKK